MKQLFSLFFTIAAFTSLNAQSTALRVYQIFQDKCVQCHSNADPQAGLDLEGQGTNTNAKVLSVYNNLVNATPTNATAAAKGDKYLYPGRADKSFLFRKINQGIEPTLSLEEGENQPMPPYGQPLLTDVEKELIRQWIFFGTPVSGNVVSENVITDYYNGNALKSFPDGPPEAPSPEEGFQIKMGPIYLAPSQEVEYFQKYELDLPDDVDVDRIDIKFGTYSHHFIIYDFNPGGANSIPAGLRLNPDHSDIGMVAAVQEPTDLQLPGGTAFIWDDNLVLDLNTHYINYSIEKNYQAEVYVNVYTQPSGTAAQEMHTELLINYDIPIPNNANPITHIQHVNPNFGEIYVWGIMGHTHQYGTGYKVYERLPGGQQGELIYDASCPQGTPGCAFPYFDYQHIPMRYFEPLRPLEINPLYGIIHEASWLNDGPFSVNFGNTSDDEMMVMVMMYTEDLTGVVDTKEPLEVPQDVIAFPNPASDIINFIYPDNIGDVNIQLFDTQGRLNHSALGRGNNFDVDISNLSSGLYFYHLSGENGQVKSGKIVIK